MIAGCYDESAKRDDGKSDRTSGQEVIAQQEQQDCDDTDCGHEVVSLAKLTG